MSSLEVLSIQNQSQILEPADRSILRNQISFKLFFLHSDLSKEKESFD